MKRRVIAIGLDAADFRLIEKWMSQGHLKNLSKLCSEGAYGHLTNTVTYCDKVRETSITERLWANAWTGCTNNKTGYWGIEKFYPDSYEMSLDIRGAYDFKEYPPFYGMMEDRRVILFDLLSASLYDKVNGLQILGWGGHFPATDNCSSPPELLPEIIEKYGEHPVFYKDAGFWWDKEYETWVEKGIKEAVDTRSKIIRDLMQRQDWDLFLTTFGETHSAGHNFWYLSQPDHPLYSHFRNDTDPDKDPMLACYEAVDRAVGEILAEAPEDAYTFVYAVHGIAANNTDLNSLVFLPELLYRFSFPGKAALAPGKVGEVPPPVITDATLPWPAEIYKTAVQCHPTIMQRLVKKLAPSLFSRFWSEPQLMDMANIPGQSANLNWMPAMWYGSAWSQMKAFALPAFSDGHIRINLEGRERDGIVKPSEYDAVCEEITQFLYQIKDARTGKPIVDEVVRTRRSPADNDPKLPDSDLVVLWKDQLTDVVDSPSCGRIGPVVYDRTGGHYLSRGFVMAKGPGIAPGSLLPDGQAVDLAPTIMSLMEVELPSHFDGKPMPLLAVESCAGV
jgi:predicted AlkP superfamily phosphohydrolase/phosphomutase